MVSKSQKGKWKRQEAMYLKEANRANVIKIQIAKGGREVNMPQKGNRDAVAWDCRAAEGDTLMPGGTIFVSLGFHVQPPDGYHTRIWLRSSASKLGITMLHSCGIIDPDYRGVVKLALYMPLHYRDFDSNGDFIDPPLDLPNNPRVFTVKPGDRICQMTLEKTNFATIEMVSNLGRTERGSGGFGSTGVE